MRLAARVWDVVEQRPLFATHMQYARELLSELMIKRSDATVAEAVQDTLAGQIVHVYHKRLRRDDLAESAIHDFADSSPFFTATHIDTLYRSLDTYQIHTANTAAVTAVVRSLFVQLERFDGSLATPEVLSVCAQAVHDNGLPLDDVVGRFKELTNVSPGYDAIRTFYEAQFKKSVGDKDGHDALRVRYLDSFARVSRSDPAAERVEHLGRWVQSREQPQRSILAMAAQAAEAGDMVKVAKLYEVAADQAESPDQAALFRLLSEGGRLKSNQLSTADSLYECLLRLRSGHITRAKPLFDPDHLMPDLCQQAIRVQRQNPLSDIALQVADFAGDVRTGVALDHRYSSLKNATAAIADLSAVDALQRDPDVLDVRNLKASLPGASFVWVSITHDTDNVEADDSYVNVTTLSADERRSYVRSVPVPDRQDPIVRTAIGRGSEELTDNELWWLSDTIFGDLAEAAAGNGLYVIPDQAAWELPWSRLIPSYVDAYAIVPSAASAMRLLSTSHARKPRSVIGLFNTDLAGAQKELASLRALDGEGHIDFHRATTAEELATALRSRSFDLLVVTAHGTRGEGFEFSMDLGAEIVPLLSLLELPLPPAISFGCCWSARSSRSSTSVVAVLSCLLAGASTVVGGLWDIDDRASGVVLSKAYANFAQGSSLASSTLSAFRSVDESARSAAAGICVVGRW
ncbi:CHAT domain-containing protein [Mycobacterium sp. URHB0044]|uniref:CHAT domain-containing protein n=1 Tax=Mycobacterium sp. URHB0044 TaxID=1380386 RepID=UPI0018CC60F7|nr:CHAT domain-containing protein [Mycobacterium sp. URHB0044]